MLGDISKAEHIYIAVGYTDMRKIADSNGLEMNPKLEK